jgi:3-deoxy-7-phosphoheptulonate synthase
MARAAIAAGADGLLIETHPEPDKALTDAKQTICPAMLKDILVSLEPIANSIQRTL